MKKQTLIVGLTSCILIVAIVLLSPNCRFVKQQQLHHDESHAAVTSIVQTTSNDNQINGQMDAPYTLSKEVNKALEHGAKAKVTLKVVDSNGNSVCGARVHVHFTFYNRDKNEVIGVTDSSGMFTAEKETTLSFKWNIQKEGYYATNGKRFLTDGLSNDSVKNGCWQPWNPTIEVVLKEKRKPVKMNYQLGDITLPAKEIPVGYDCIKSDWVSPYGKGEVADLMFAYSFHPAATPEDERISCLIITSTTHDCGLRLMEKDKWSKLPSVYEAPEDGYKSQFTLITRSVAGKTLENVELTSDDYLIFRSRIERDNTGKIIKAHYGKIYGAIQYGGSPKNKNGVEIRINWYFNPNPNDRNLEATGEYP